MLPVCDFSCDFVCDFFVISREVYKKISELPLESESFKYDYSRFKEDTFLDDFNQIDFTYLVGVIKGVRNPPFRAIVS